MKNIFITIFVLSILLLGCAPSQMSISENDLPNISPIGLYIIASTQIIDKLDSLQSEFTIKTAGKSICEYFESKGYYIKQLNSVLPVKDVFDKYIGSFYINEDTVASIAEQNGCSTFLIVYYAYAGSRCSLYGWLGYSKNAEIISSSHKALNSFSAYRTMVKDKYNGYSDNEIYKHFLADMAIDMFNRIKPNPKK
jgi:hypothetical protein